jgi:hypothetical protein
MFEILSITDIVYPKGKAVEVRYTHSVYTLEYELSLPYDYTTEQINSAVEADFNRWKLQHP